MYKSKIEDRLLATHISNNPEFEVACLTCNCEKIRAIVEAEMEEHNLYTKGSRKLRDDIFRKLGNKLSIPSFVGSEILMFVWNSRMSGIGLAVENQYIIKIQKAVYKII